MYLTHSLQSGAVAKVERAIERSNVQVEKRKAANLEAQQKATKKAKGEVAEWKHQAQQMKKMFREDKEKEGCDCSVDFSSPSR